ncbi:MAG: spore germination protein [Clostridia bacterium]|nr:spore germination protein [Clostridia bacterium]
MFEFIKKRLKSMQNEKLQEKNTAKDKESKISKSLKENLGDIKSTVGNSSDVIMREFSFGHGVCAALIFIDGMTDKKVINESIIEPLMYGFKCSEIDSPDIEKIKLQMIAVSEVKDVDSMDKVIEGFLAGNTVLLMDGSNKALVINTTEWEKRSVEEPQTESVIRGSREGFTENMRTNTSLLRRKIRNPNLVIDKTVIGKSTNTAVCVVYIKGIANTELVDEVKSRLEKIDTDSILESGYIEQYIEDAPLSIFSTVAYTEKPDVVAAKILEGRVAIIVDGTPFVLTVPMFFVESFQTTEDYYSRFYFMNMLRIVRYISYLITILAPAVYVAITTFHQELIPTKLLFTMMEAREGIPFPAFIETLIMLLAFEILREAGVRMPRTIGQALSIVGALVMGEAAVSAGIVGAPMVIIIAITAVSIFNIPYQADSAAILRFIFLILAATMGLYGITMGLLGTLVHLSSLKSFSFPYLFPVVPFDIKGNKDAVIRAPLWTMRRRPNGMSKKNPKRHGNFIHNPMQRKDK